MAEVFVKFGKITTNASVRPNNFVTRVGHYLALILN